MASDNMARKRTARCESSALTGLSVVAGVAVVPAGVAFAAADDDVDTSLFSLALADAGTR